MKPSLFSDSTITDEELTNLTFCSWEQICSFLPPFCVLSWELMTGWGLRGATVSLGSRWTSLLSSFLSSLPPDSSNGVSGISWSLSQSWFKVGPKIGRHFVWEFHRPKLPNWSLGWKKGTQVSWVPQHIWGSFELMSCGNFNTFGIIRFAGKLLAKLVVWGPSITKIGFKAT